MSRRRDPLTGISAVSIGNDRPVAKKEQVAGVERETAPAPPAPLPREVLDAPIPPSVPERSGSPTPPTPKVAPPHYISQQQHSTTRKLRAALGRLFRQKNE